MFKGRKEEEKKGSLAPLRKMEEEVVAPRKGNFEHVERGNSIIQNGGDFDREDTQILRRKKNETSLPREDDNTKSKERSLNMKAKSIGILRNPRGVSVFLKFWVRIVLAV